MILKKHMLLALAVGLTLTVQAQNAATLTVKGEVATPLTLTAADLASMKTVTHTGKDHGNQEHTFAGVPLIALLEKAGAITGSALRGKNLTRYLLVQAADGYEVVYSLPEVDPEFSDRMVLVVYQKDGQPLPAGEGPFRLVAPGDKKQARWVREVRTITVLVAKP